MDIHESVKRKVRAKKFDELTEGEMDYLRSLMKDIVDAFVPGPKEFQDEFTRNFLKLLIENIP